MRLVILLVLVVVAALVVFQAAGIARASAPELVRRLFSAEVFFALLPYAAWSYGLRVLRWAILVRRIEPSLSWLSGAFSQITGFALSASPGRLAEVYKLRILDQSAGVAFSRGLPAIVVERLTDIVGLVFLVAVGTLSLSTSGTSGPTVRMSPGTWATGLGLAVLLVGLSACQSRCPSLLRRIRGWNHVEPIIAQIRVGGQRVMSPPVLLASTLCVTLGRLGDGVVLWRLAATMGFPISFVVACLIVGTAGLAGGLSLTPGGVGAAEAALAGLLMVHGLPGERAIVVALASRTFSYWIWVGVGALALVATSRWRSWEYPRVPQTVAAVSPNAKRRS